METNFPSSTIASTFFYCTNITPIHIHTHKGLKKGGSKNWIRGPTRENEWDEIFTGSGCSHPNTTSHTYHVEKIHRKMFNVSNFTSLLCFFSFTFFFISISFVVVVIKVFIVFIVLFYSTVFLFSLQFYVLQIEFFNTRKFITK